MLNINWRSPAEYQNTERITAAGFAWEYIRRDDEYQSDYQKIQRARRPGKRSLANFSKRWCLRFPCDPRLPADRLTLFWDPSVQPLALQLSSVPAFNDTEMLPITLTRLDGADLKCGYNDCHGIWRVDDVTHAFWSSDATPDADAFYTVILPLDRFFELRTHAARRFWRALNGRAPGPDYRVMPRKMRSLHILSLRTLDARLRGESYRTIAEVLLGFRGTKEDWEADRRKNKARRLAAYGFRMMKGGYRALLHYPLKPPKR